MTTMRKCLICNNLFEPKFNDDSERLCSNIDCKQKYAESRKRGDFDAKYKLKVCNQCGNQFFSRDSRRVYCSKECAYEAKMERNRRNSAKHRQLSKSVKRPDESKVCCAVCGAPLSGRQTRFCSKRCNLILRKYEYLLKKDPTNLTLADVLAEANRAEEFIPKKSDLQLKREKLRQAEAEIAAMNSGHFVQQFRNSEERKASEKEQRRLDFIERRNRSDYEDLVLHNKRKAERERWEKIPLEDAAAICKQYGLSYGEYQSMKYTGRLEAYMRGHDLKESE